jgi:hypothetical protein
MGFLSLGSNGKTIPGPSDKKVGPLYTTAHVLCIDMIFFLRTFLTAEVFLSHSGFLNHIQLVTR